MIFKHISNGDSFSSKQGNTSAYCKMDNVLLMIDCGETVFKDMMKENILNGLDDIYVAITHFHPDHVGSLGSLIMYMYYAKDIKVNVLYPKPKKIEELLSIMGVNKDIYVRLPYINEDTDALLLKENIGLKSLIFKNTTHVPDLEAYSIHINTNKGKYLFTGDSNKYPIIDNYDDYKAIFVDTTMFDYKGNPHIHFDSLLQLVDKKDRHKVYCVHLSDNADREYILELGFMIPKGDKLL